MTTAAATTTGMTSSQRWVLGLMSVASFMISLDSLVVSTAIPTIHRDLNATLGSLEWTVNAYNLTFAVLLMTGAAVGDRFGRRRMFVAGLGLFTLASVACALSPTIEALIAARAVQGVGAALVMPLATTQLSAAFPPQQRGKALGIFIGVAGLATFFGPAVGGLLAEKLSWQWIFWINVPIGVVAIVLVLLRITESHGPNTSFDLVGVLLVTAGTFGLVWGLQRGNSVGWGSLEVVGPLIAGAVLMGVFVFWENHTQAPLLPMRFFAIRAFTASNIAVFFLFAVIYGMNFMLAQFLQNSQGNGPLGAGLRMMPLTLGVLVFAPIAGSLADRFGERSLVAGGLILQAIGPAIVAFMVTPDIGYLKLIVPLFVCGIGSVFAIPSTQRAVVGAVELQDIGKASGAVSMMRYMGGVFGIAILGAVFASYGNYSSAQSFSDGFGPSLATIAAFSLAGGIAGLFIPKLKKAVAAAPSPKSPQPAAVTPTGDGAGQG